MVNTYGEAPPSRCGGFQSRFSAAILLISSEPIYLNSFLVNPPEISRSLTVFAVGDLGFLLHTKAVRMRASKLSPRIHVEPTLMETSIASEESRLPNTYAQSQGPLEVPHVISVPPLHIGLVFHAGALSLCHGSAPAI